MQVAAPQGVKIYNVSAGKSLEDWILDNRDRAVKLRAHDASRLDLIQDFNFTTLATHVKVTRDNKYVVAAGVYPPLIRVYDVADLSLKFERGLECDVVGYEILTEDYSKMIVARSDRMIEFHVKGGKLHQSRLPKAFRDMTYYAPSCDMLFASASPEVFRINLDQGRFMAPYETKRPSVNFIKQNPFHHLLALGGEDGVVEFWDPRARTSVATLNTGMSEVFSAAYDDDGLSIVIGGSEGNVNLYDIRSALPVVTKQHQNELPIRFVDFHNDGGLKRVASADSKALKIWEKRTGKHFISIEPKSDIRDVCFNKGSGLIFFAVDDPKVQSYYVPALGPAPKWCSFLDNLTEEMEEEKQVDYSDYKFVTRDELFKFGLNRLIGSRFLKEYMHGFFMDMGLYTKVKSMMDPQNLQAMKKEKIRQTLSSKAASRIQTKKKNSTADEDRISSLVENVKPFAARPKRSKTEKVKKIDKNVQFNDDELLGDFNAVDDVEEEAAVGDEENEEGEEESANGTPNKKRKLQFYELKSGKAAPFTRVPKNISKKFPQNGNGKKTFSKQERPLGDRVKSEGRKQARKPNKHS